MAKFLAILQLIAQLMPALISLVKQFESALPNGGQGATKLAAVRAALEAAYAVNTDATIKFEELWPTLQTTISGIVAMYNAAGIFKKA